MTLEELAALGIELKRLGWKRHLEPLRVLYAATRDGGRSEWTLKHAAFLASTVGLGPAPLQLLPKGSRCPKCPPHQQGTWSGRRTVMSLPDRVVYECSKCSSAWVVIE